MKVLLAVFVLVAGASSQADPAWEERYYDLTLDERRALDENLRDPNGRILGSRLDWIRMVEDNRPVLQTDEDLWKLVELDCEVCNRTDDEEFKAWYFDQLKRWRDEDNARIDDQIARLFDDASGDYRRQLRREGREAAAQVRAKLKLAERKLALYRAREQQK